MNLRPKMPLVFALYVLVVIVVSLVPTGGLSLWHIDKIGHFLAYTGMAILGFLTFRSGSARILALLFAVALGAALEWGQSFIPGRDMSLIDESANTLGVLCGAVIFRLRGEYLQKYIGRL